MNTTTAAVGTGALVVVGRWSEGDTISVRVVVGVVFLAVFLSIMPPKIATQFGYLIMFVVAARYLPGIVGRSGITQATDGNRPRGHRKGARGGGVAGA